MGEAIGSAGEWLDKLEGKELRALLTHHPMTEKRSSIRQMHEGLGAIHVPIGAIHELKPKAAETVQIPDATVETEMPGIELGEAQGVVFWPFRVKTELQSAIGFELELVSLLLDHRIDWLRFSRRQQLELLSLKEHQAVLCRRQWLQICHGKVLQLGDLIHQPSTIDPSVMPLFQPLMVQAIQSHIGTITPMLLKSLKDPIGFSTAGGGK